jgi:hypothetical protein
MQLSEPGITGPRLKMSGEILKAVPPKTMDAFTAVLQGTIRVLIS